MLVQNCERQSVSCLNALRRTVIGKISPQALQLSADFWCTGRCVAFLNSLLTIIVNILPDSISAVYDPCPHFVSV